MNLLQKIPICIHAFIGLISFSAFGQSRDRYQHCAAQ